MLDITSIKKPVFEIQIAEGVILHVLPPTKNTFERALKLQTSNVNEMYGITAELLSNNEEKRKVSLEEVTEYDWYTVRKIFDEFLRFVINFSKDPN